MIVLVLLSPKKEDLKAIKDNQWQEGYMEIKWK